MLIPISLIFGVQILKTLSQTCILLWCKTSIGFYDLMFYAHCNIHFQPQEAIARQGVPWAILFYFFP